MDLTPDQHAEFARLYEKSLKEALEGLDRIAAEAKEMQTVAIEEIIRTKEERKKIEDSADEVAKEILATRQKQMEQDIRKRIETDFAMKLVRAGRSRLEINTWLGIDSDIIEQVRNLLVFKTSPDIDAYVDISWQGAGGTVRFLQGDMIADFPWEFGSNNVFALIYIPNEQNWEAQTGIPPANRMVILDWIAKQVIFQRATGCIYRILDDVIEIVSP